MTISQSAVDQHVLSMGVGALLKMEVPLGHFAVQLPNSGKKGLVNDCNITTILGV
jgi:hypothetical protein